MIEAWLAVLMGFVVLVWGTNRFIDGAACTAKHLGMSPLLIGIIIVGFGTSLPEMLVSAQAALNGNPGLALGNAIGSNIINTGLVLGLTAIIAPIAVNSDIVRKEIPLLLAIGLLFGWFIYDRSLTRVEATVLLTGFFSLIGFAVYSARSEKDDQLGVDVDDNLRELELGRSLFWLLFGLTLMIVSSRILTWGAVEIAQLAGLSNLTIGLTVVAFGTSLPELSASVIAALKAQHDIAIGNVVGSNMFNLLAVAGIAGFIAPFEVASDQAFYRDWTALMLLSLALWFMAYGYGRRGELSRFDGSLLLLGFATHLVVLGNAVL